MGSWQKFSFKFLFLLICAALLASCFSTKLPSVNENFEKKYGEEVYKMNSDRVSGSASNQITVMQSPTPADVNAALASRDYYAYVDVNKFNEKAPETYLPNGESYEQTKAASPANSLPADMFEVTYNLGLYPAFRRAGAEFDRIPIPPQDVYGVKTEMSEKSYLLAGNDSMQKAVDHMITAKTSDDIENSEILIKERKQQRREHRMVKTFGESGMEMASLEKKEIKAEEKKSDKKEK